MAKSGNANFKHHRSGILSAAPTNAAFEVVFFCAKKTPRRRSQNTPANKAGIFLG